MTLLVNSLCISSSSNSNCFGLFAAVTLIFFFVDLTPLYQRSCLAAGSSSIIRDKTDIPRHSIWLIRFVSVDDYTFFITQIRKVKIIIIPQSYLCVGFMNVFLSAETLPLSFDMGTMFFLFFQMDSERHVV